MCCVSSGHWRGGKVRWCSGRAIRGRGPVFQVCGRRGPVYCSRWNIYTKIFEKYIFTGFFQDISLFNKKGNLLSTNWLFYFVIKSMKSPITNWNSVRLLYWWIHLLIQLVNHSTSFSLIGIFNWIFAHYNIECNLRIIM